MDTIWTALQMMKLECNMAPIDLEDTYYSVLVNDQNKRNLKFSWNGNLYQFTCCPNGPALCPRKSPNLLEPVHSTLRKKGHLSIGYIDDS